jgi:hypothetical protein
LIGIIITNPDLEYERFNVELPFSYALNLRSVGFNSRTELRRSWVQLVTVLKNG